MSESRLSLAISSGVIDLPEHGDIVVLCPPKGYDLSALPRARVLVVQGFKPDHDAFAAAGYAVTTTAPVQSALSIVVVPRAKSQGLHLLAEAAMRGPVVIDGLKSHGVESVLKAVKTRAQISPPVSKAHGKLALIQAGPDQFADWRRSPSRIAGGWLTVPGAFSSDAPDPGSVALADICAGRLNGDVVDLGAGWGYLAARALESNPKVARLSLVEADHAALEIAKHNVTDSRATFHWADARDWGRPGETTHVITNPPFHVDRAADPALGRSFIAAAARLLSARGTLWLVANRHLPYETTLREAFREVEDVSAPQGYKLVRAARPIRPRNWRG